MRCSSARALAATAVAELLYRRFLLPSFSLRLQHQRKAGNEFKCVLFSVKNIEFAPRLLTKYYKCKSFIRFSLMLQAQRKAWQKKAPLRVFRCLRTATGGVAGSHKLLKKLEQNSQ
ncbi:MAG: hypothetical protein IKK94_01660 [Clostridia bacterium]|nr:hypothetical protein [Clostridia bacterium]